MFWKVFVCALAVLTSPAAVRATLDVNPAHPITRRVTVQLVQTALDSGSSPATVFGDAAQRTAIEANIDVIWAQAGIDINFLPTVTRWNDTFAYQGSGGSGSRSNNDFGTVLNNAVADGVLNSNSNVLNLVMVNVVPGFAPLSENTSAGLARVNGNGINGFVGDDLLSWQGGREVIAGVMAHEIAHNLGLNHTGSSEPNLMSPRGTTEQLDSTQISTARASRYALAITLPSLSGDYNGNGTVDAADYTVWRNTLNQTGAGLAADGNANGRVDAGDLTVWRSAVGNVRSGSSVIASSSISGISFVPEPNTLVSALAIFVCTIATFRRAR